MIKTKSIIDNPKQKVFVYLLECADGSYYCGVAIDVEARFKKHLAGKGAAYTRSHTPVRILDRKEHESMSAALKAECVIKKLKKLEKIANFAK